MKDTDLYAQILGLRSPWKVAETSGRRRLSWTVEAVGKSQRL